MASWQPCEAFVIFTWPVINAVDGQEQWLAQRHWTDIHETYCNTEYASVGDEAASFSGSAIAGCGNAAFSVEATPGFWAADEQMDAKDSCVINTKFELRCIPASNRNAAFSTLAKIVSNWIQLKRVPSLYYLTAFDSFTR